MAKVKVKFFCQECGYESPKWLGRCPGCGQWNSMVEEIHKPSRKGKTVDSQTKPQPISDIQTSEGERLLTGSKELNRVLGGGIIPGSLVLVGGDPGIGKSTLLLQIACFFARDYGPLLYVSGEESASQIRMRADRIGILSPNLLVLPETNYESIENHINNLMPGLVIIDSIQTIFSDDISSAPGSVSQVRECTGLLLRLAKTKGIPVFIVGHVTKEGTIAGPRVLEHMVDTVLYFEGERHNSFRILRSVKNRFGSTNEIGIFEMQEKGLMEVENPSEIFLAERPQGDSGSVVIPSIEGTRPVLVELQALVSPTTFGNPRRMATGVDYNRLSLLVAVLDKRVGLHLSNQDIYINIAGGVKVDEPAVDLGIVLALASSFKDLNIDEKMVAFGEIGLTGEVRAVNQVDKRLSEAEKLGFRKCLLPASNLKKYKNTHGLELVGVRNVSEALEYALGGG